MFETIKEFFSTRYDLLAIALFVGAFIALMISELFNWILSSFISLAVPETSSLFTLIALLMLLLKLVLIAFILVAIDRAYNRRVRSSSSKWVQGKRVYSKPESSAEQLYNRFVNSDKMRYKSILEQEVLLSSEDTVNEADADESTESSRSRVRRDKMWRKREQLLSQLEELLDEEDATKNTVEILDSIDVLTEDFKQDAVTLNSSKTSQQVEELSSEKIRSVLAKR